MDINNFFKKELFINIYNLFYYYYFCFKELMEELAIHSVSTSPTRFKELLSNFEQATKLEIAFWEMAINKN